MTKGGGLAGTPNSSTGPRSCAAACVSAADRGCSGLGAPGHIGSPFAARGTVETGMAEVEAVAAVERYAAPADPKRLVGAAGLAVEVAGVTVAVGAGVTIGAEGVAAGR